MSNEKAFDLDYVKQAVANIEAEECDESAHMAEDALQREFIELVAEVGSAELAEMAREVLKTGQIEFGRWYA